MEANTDEKIQHTILLVDDDPILLDTVADLLTVVGHVVIKARDGAEALERLAIMHPDLIITDILMPGIDGYELLRHVLHHPEWQKIPLVFLSARWRENEILEAMSRGAAAFLTKPFDAEELFSKVNEIIGNTHNRSGD